MLMRSCRILLSNKLIHRCRLSASLATTAAKGDNQRHGPPASNPSYANLVSAVCGVICVLLIVMWVRSWWWADWIDQFDNAKIQTSIGSALRRP